MGGRSNNCKASLTAEADPLCKGEGLQSQRGWSAIPTGVVCVSFIGVGCISSSSSSSGWDGPSLSATLRSCPEVCPPCLVAVGVGATADLRVDCTSSTLGA